MIDRVVAFMASLRQLVADIVAPGSSLDPDSRHEVARHDDVLDAAHDGDEIDATGL